MEQSQSQDWHDILHESLVKNVISNWEKKSENQKKFSRSLVKKRLFEPWEESVYEDDPCEEVVRLDNPEKQRKKNHTMIEAVRVFENPDVKEDVVLKTFREVLLTADLPMIQVLWEVLKENKKEDCVLNKGLSVTLYSAVSADDPENMLFFLKDVGFTPDYKALEICLKALIFNQIKTHAIQFKKNTLIMLLVNEFEAGLTKLTDINALKKTHPSLVERVKTQGEKYQLNEVLKPPKEGEVIRENPSIKRL